MGEIIGLEWDDVELAGHTTLAKPKWQNPWHHADLRGNAVRFRAFFWLDAIAPLSGTSILVPSSSLPSWQTRANSVDCLQAASVGRREQNPT
jgi:hypothetical protein